MRAQRVSPRCDLTTPANRLADPPCGRTCPTPSDRGVGTSSAARIRAVSGGVLAQGAETSRAGRASDVWPAPSRGAARALRGPCGRAWSVLATRAGSTPAPASISYIGDRTRKSAGGMTLLLPLLPSPAGLRLPRRPSPPFFAGLPGNPAQRGVAPPVLRGVFFARCAR